MARKASVQLTIRELAEEFGLTLRALRFYETRGFLAPRRDGRDRVYSDTDRANLDMVLQGKRLGFTLSEIQDLICQRPGTRHRSGLMVAIGDLRLTSRQIDEQLTLLRDQRAGIEKAIADLEAVVAGASGDTSSNRSQPAREGKFKNERVNSAS